MAVCLKCTIHHFCAILTIVSTQPCRLAGPMVSLSVSWEGSMVFALFHFMWLLARNSYRWAMFMYSFLKSCYCNVLCSMVGIFWTALRSTIVWEWVSGWQPEGGGGALGAASSPPSFSNLSARLTACFSDHSCTLKFPMRLVFLNVTYFLVQTTRHNYSV